MAPNHISLNQLIHCYPLREEPAQKEERIASILRYNFQKHPLTPQFCTAVLGPKFAFWCTVLLQQGSQKFEMLFTGSTVGYKELGGSLTSFQPHLHEYLNQESDWSTMLLGNSDWSDYTLKRQDKYNIYQQHQLLLK